MTELERLLAEFTVEPARTGDSDEAERISHDVSGSGKPSGAPEVSEPGGKDWLDRADAAIKKASQGTEPGVTMTRTAP